MNALTRHSARRLARGAVLVGVCRAATTALALAALSPTFISLDAAAAPQAAGTMARPSMSGLPGTRVPSRPCQVALPASVANSLASQWTKARSFFFIPFDAIPAGPFLAQVSDRDFTGVGLVAADLSGYRRVDRFADPAAYQAMGSDDGRFGIWKETQRLDTLDVFVVKTFDRATGRVRTIGRSAVDGDGQTPPSPWRSPSAAAGYGAWVQGSDATGTTQVHLVRLRDGRTWTVRTGHPSETLIYRGSLIYTESPAPGALTRMYAVDLATRAPVTAPAALRSVRGAWDLATDGTAIAWARDAGTLAYAPTGGSSGRVVFRVKTGGLNPLPQLAGGIVATATSQGTILVDPRTTSSAIAVRDGGLAVASGDRFLIAPAAIKGQPWGNRWATVPASAIRLATCTTTAG